MLLNLRFRVYQTSATARKRVVSCYASIAKPRPVAKWNVSVVVYVDGTGIGLSLSDCF